MVSFLVAITALCVQLIVPKEVAMCEEAGEEELPGWAIERFVRLQAEEGKTADEAVEALMESLGCDMPIFAKQSTLANAWCIRRREKGCYGW